MTSPTPRDTEELRSKGHDWAELRKAAELGLDDEFREYGGIDWIWVFLDALDENAALREQVAGLREALAPFAEMATPIEEALEIGPYVFDGFYFSPPHPELKYTVRVRLGDLRRARSTLEDS